ncbi:MAG: Trk family potassium uptake protein [Clostridia bacterium]|nr:Trk family potassium uptake protein [Clostridia bacterium]
MQLKRHFKLTSAQVIIFGFAGLIILATLLLMLPISSADGNFTPFLNAAFTATSATCVTGLVVYDTATHWSAFGQAVILILIQIGGMGVVTIAVCLSRLSGKKLGLLGRSFMQDSISAPRLGGIMKFTNFIIITALSIELIGALSLMPTFCGRFGLKGIWYAFFHAISAFCNAGFDVMGHTGEFSSLTSFVGNIPVNTVVMLLIIIGGIGFSTWNDIKTHGIRLRRYTLQSKVILVITALFIILPALFFFFVQFSDMKLKERVLSSLFQSVTLRTAGFNTVDFSALGGGTLAIMTVFMLIGGAPGSTAGGMKVTTVAIMFFSMLSVFSRKREVRVGNRRIDDENVKTAAAILMMYVVLFFAGGIAISISDGLPLQKCLFETASAIGTVGLSTGITTSLSAFSRVVIILLMYIGRVGGLTVIFAAAKSSVVNSKLPLEKITVG